MDTNTRKKKYEELIITENDDVVTGLEDCRRNYNEAQELKDALKIRFDILEEEMKSIQSQLDRVNEIMRTLKRKEKIFTKKWVGKLFEFSKLRDIKVGVRKSPKMSNEHATNSPVLKSYKNLATNTTHAHDNQKPGSSKAFYSDLRMSGPIEDKTKNSLNPKAKKLRTDSTTLHSQPIEKTNNDDEVVGSNEVQMNSYNLLRHWGHRLDKEFRPNPPLNNLKRPSFTLIELED